MRLSVQVGLRNPTLAGDRRWLPPAKTPVRYSAVDGARTGVSATRRATPRPGTRPRETPRRSQLAVALLDIDASKRQGTIPPLFQRGCGLHLTPRRVPQNAVHTRGSFAGVFGHPPHSERLAAERVGQEALQGFHLAPPPSLRRLHDTRLEPPHDLVDRTPIDVVPADCVAGDCAGWRRCCRHSLCPLWWFAMLSRDFRPSGSLPAFARGDVATPIPAITAGHSLSPPSSTRSPIGSPYGSLSLAGGLRAYRVPQYPCGEARGIAACDFQRGVMVASPLADWPVDVRIRPRRRALPRLPGQASSSTAAGRRGAGPGGTRYGRVRQPARPEGRRRSASPSRSGC